MSSSAKSQKQPKAKQEEQVAKPEKKAKSKKKKKELVHESQAQDNPSKQSSSSIKQPKVKSEHSIIAKQQPSQPRSAPDRIAEQLSSLHYDGLLTQNHFLCQAISSHLQRVTINLYQSMIMHGSLIHNAITLARQSGLTPRDYFSIFYTNKLQLIKKLLIKKGANKFAKYIAKIDQEVKRVEGMIVRSLEVDVYSMVLLDLKKLNLEWQLREDL